MNSARKIVRRRFLLGTGGIAVGLPFLESFLPKKATAQGANTRLLIVYSPNGSNNISECMPTGDGSNFTFGPESVALTPYKSKLLVISGLEITHPTDNGDQHTIAMASMLTGIKPGYDAKFEDVATSVGGGWAGGISVDQELAKTVGATTKYQSLQFGVQTSYRYGNHPIGRLSYARASQPLPPEDDPAAAFARLFSNITGPTPPGMLDANLKRDKSVMDFVIAEFGAVSGAVSAADKQRLDQHVSMLREVERGLTVTPVSNLASCTGATFSSVGDPSLAANFPALAKQQRELTVLALSCGLTRIASLQYSYARSLQTFPWLNLPSDHHSMSHGDALGSDGTKEINIWYASEFAELLKSLDAVNEGAATLLDNCLGWWCSDVSDGGTHSWNNLRAFLFGSAGGRVKNGQFITYGTPKPPVGDMDASWTNGKPTNALHVTLLNAFGVPATTFGDPQVGSGPLPGVLA